MRHNCVCAADMLQNVHSSWEKDRRISWRVNRKHSGWCGFPRLFPLSWEIRLYCQCKLLPSASFSSWPNNHRLSFQKIPLRDFSSEVRANLDIEKFVKEAVVLLDVVAQDLETIVDHLLRAIHASSTNHELLAEMKSDDVFLTEAKRALFMQINVPTYSCEFDCCLFCLNLLEFELGVDSMLLE